MNGLEITYIKDDESDTEYEVHTDKPESVAPAESEIPEALKHVAGAEDVQYEFEESDGSVETYKTTGPDANQPEVDPATLLRRQKRLLKIAKILRKRQTQANLRAEQRVARKAKNRKKSKMQKASRKKNR